MSDGGFDLLDAQRAVFRSPLRSTEKLVALALLDHWSRGSATFPSFARLAEWTSLERRTVIRTVQGLEQQGAVVVTKRPYQPSLFDLRPLAALQPVSDDHQCQTITSDPVSPDQCQTITPLVIEDHPKEPIEVTQGRNPLDASAPNSSPTKGAPKRRRKAPEVPLPADWQPTEAHRAYAAKHGLNVDLEADSMRGWADGRMAVSWNGTFATRLANQAKWNRERQGKGRNGAPIVQSGAVLRKQDSSWLDGPEGAK